MVLFKVVLVAPCPEKRNSRFMTLVISVSYVTSIRGDKQVEAMICMSSEGIRHIWHGCRRDHSAVTIDNGGTLLVCLSTLLRASTSVFRTPFILEGQILVSSFSDWIKRAAQNLASPWRSRLGVFAETDIHEIAVVLSKCAVIIYPPVFAPKF